VQRLRNQGTPEGGWGKQETAATTCPTSPSQRMMEERKMENIELEKVDER